MGPVQTVAPHTSIDTKAYLAVIVAALGYFVDIYDLILFSIVRVASLRDIGVAPAELLPTGVYLLNMQMVGMLIGGLIWGILGDKRGRLSVLFGSIFLYSIANIGNGMVHSIGSYAALRFIAGVGLAGELGAGVTLVSEVLPTHIRGYGTTIVAAVGILGAVVASLVGDMFSWRTAFYVGGAMGLALLVLRIGVVESGMFHSAKEQHDVSRGDFLMLFRSAHRAMRYVSVIAVAIPVWYVIGILTTFAPELGRDMGMAVPPTASRSVMFCYVGLSLGGVASGVLSQMMRSRKRVLALFLAMTAALIVVYFAVGWQSLTLFYTTVVALGFAGGYWAVFITTASEQFGTNIRATVTTTAPNFVRGAVVLLTSAFQALAGPLGLQNSAILVGAVTMLIAFASLAGLHETYGKDLGFVEED
jgi:MFS transporter, putative metabolite:H+ symporter